MRTTDADRGQRTIVGAIFAPSGNPSRGAGFTCTRISAGSYTLRVPGFRALTAAMVTITQTVGMARSSITGPDSVDVNIYNASGAVIDYNFDFAITGLPAAAR